MTITKTTEIFT